VGELRSKAATVIARPTSEIPLVRGQGFRQNQVWCEIVALACELLAWTQMLALPGPARRWEPKRVRLRVFSVVGRLTSGGRCLRLRLAERWPWAGSITAAVARLQAIPTG
jgi:hypothetical protein